MRLKEVISSLAHPKSRVRSVLAFSTGVYSLMMLMLGYAWYSQQWGSGFHFFDDVAEWKQMDKFAHFFWSFQVSVVATRLFTWAQSDERKSVLGGAALALLFVSSIEIFDGFSESYGASVYDIAANTAGCIVFIIQRFVFKNIIVWPKFSFHPTVFAPLRPAMLGNGLLEEILKDYNGQTFWYSASVKWLPFPSWLTLAVGVGAEGMVYGRDEQNEAAGFSPYRKYFLSFDLNVSGVQTKWKGLNAFLNVFNIVKFPAPAVEISREGVRFHVVYF